MGAPWNTTNSPGLAFPISQAVAEVIEHGPAIMRHQDAVSNCCRFQEIRILYASQLRIGG